MTEEKILAPTEATEASDQNTTQADETPTTKTYTQKEVDDMMGRMRGSLEKKLLKPYAELGDVTELKQMKAEAEAKAQEQAIKRGEFQKTLQELAAKKDDEISKRDSIIKEYKVNTPLVNAAAKYKSVNPEQVRNLLSSSVRLNDDGDVEVVDNQGNVKYDDKGLPIDVDSLVRGFLDSNPHFLSATPTTTNSSSAITGGDTKAITYIADLDLNNPAHRVIYKKMQQSGKLNNLI